MIFHSEDIIKFKQKALQWANGFDVCCCLDANNLTDPYSKFDVLIAAGVKNSIATNTGNAFDQLQQFRAINTGWITGFFGYELKNELETLTSTNTDHLQFPDLYFFAPQHLIIIKGNEVHIVTDIADEIWKTINRQPVPSSGFTKTHLAIKARLSKAEYISKANQIKDHIGKGNIYVTNFCQEFYAEQAEINPLDTYCKLSEVSPNPFGCYFKYNHQYIIGASPERYLAKRGNQLISQPIKGTAARNEGHDEQLKQQLRNNPKEQQENVMIVDLVRNDLTRCAKPGSVKVEELFGIYSFKQVHQMISTVVCELKVGLNAVDAIKSTFPMGSMTGAPKVSAMQLMDKYESSKRGIYSGAVGYFSPDDDFDFNVVIRTILYNAESKYLSFHTGSAITFDADAEKEHEECLLKAKAILEVLGVSKSFLPS